jgi:eukaryotic-like serine/threonine-protein kinase
VVVVLIAVIVLLKFVGGNGNGSGRGSPVPDVAGETLAQAESTLVKQGFQLGTEKSQASTTVTKGDVISTTPGAGTTEPKGTKVDIIWSSGSADVKVPDVIGESTAAAQNRLTQLGFHVNVTTAQQAGTNPSTVFNQSPLAGAELRPGSTVDITVTPGPQTVPSSVIGETEEQAQQVLTGAPYNYNVSISEGPGTAQVSTPGDVYETEPLPGQQLAPGGNITIFVVQQSSPSPSPSPSMSTSPGPTPSP